MTMVIAIALALLTGAGQDPFGDAAAITAFQRAADNYAFTHRQVERRHGTPAAVLEGALFTPTVAAAFRARIAIAIRRVACEPPEPPSVNFVVPRVNTSASGTLALSPCIAAVLPRLPVELAYRTAGVALLLVDAHTGVVVDVVHAAFP
jgi:hypothetical protein